MAYLLSKLSLYEDSLNRFLRVYFEALYVLSMKFAITSNLEWISRVDLSQSLPEHVEYRVYKCRSVLLFHL